MNVMKLMKKSMPVLLAAACLAGSCALADNTTYVFPYEGMRYTQQDNETVLTQTNLDKNKKLIESLGTTKEAILASYVASGIVMEVIPDEGGQIAVSVVPAQEYAARDEIMEMTGAELEEFVAKFEESGLYESVGIVNTEPLCIRMTSSAMYGSMPVYSLRYVTLHLGRLYMLTQTIVDRELSEADDARMENVLSGIRLLSNAAEATPEPTPTPTPAPTATPVPTPGVAALVSGVGDIVVNEFPAYVTRAEFTVTGSVEAGATVNVLADGKRIGSATAKSDGTFSVKATLPDEGDYTLTIGTSNADAIYKIRYEMQGARLEITEPTETTFTGREVTVRGKTEAGASVYVKGKGVNTNVRANDKGDFSVRVAIEDASTQEFSIRARATGFKETETTVTLTRVYTEKEGLAAFRQKIINVTYDTLLNDPNRFIGRNFSFRGKIVEFTDYDGRPCALVCVSNPGTGVWRDPVWIVLRGDETVTVGDIVTFFVVGEGQTLPASGEYRSDGVDVEAPVVHAAFWTTTR